MYIKVTWSKNRNVKVLLNQSEVTTHFFLDPVASPQSHRHFFQKTLQQLKTYSQQASFAINLHGGITVCLSPEVEETSKAGT